MAVKDLTRWTENEDGSWSRIVSDESVKIGIKDLADPIEQVAADVLIKEVSATTGAVAAAEKLGVDLATVTGTGKDGKVTKADVEAAA